MIPDEPIHQYGPLRVSPPVYALVHVTSSI
jgi:hypothetical protein